MKGRKPHKKPYSPMGAVKGKKPIFNGPETMKGPSEDDMPPVMGGKARMRLDRPGRKLGGRVGADRAPMSTAAKRC